MALIEYGVTLCPLCGEPINTPEECISFPHFIEDRGDPFWQYSDAAFHKKCFESWPNKLEFIARFETFKRISEK
ncbi:MAG: hypothetical protein H5T61_15665 [Thermoflexales bacterium]|nr:hypothetical protein [Thermoflexales bacterium]